MILTPELIIQLIQVGATVKSWPDGSFVVIGTMKHSSEEKASDRSARYYSRAKARNISVVEWNNRRMKVLSRDGNKCVYCGSDGDGNALHCDHVVALFRGGSSDISNLATACKRCNSSKKDKSVEEWRAGR